MGAIEVGTVVIWHSDYGDVPAWVIEYEEGRPEGDYRIAGFTNTAMKEAGAGVVFNVRSVFGEEHGAFSVR